MKYLLTESQYRILIEQPESRFGPEQFMSHSERQDFHSGNSQRAGQALVSGSEKQINYIHSLDPHTTMTILQIGTAFIPFIGPFISAGIGLADAAMYYKEGDTKTAGLIGVFSAIPGIGGLAAKMGLSKWSARALGEIGKKISLGSKLTSSEIQVVNRVAQYRQLIQTEMAKLGEKATIEAAKSAAKQGLVKTAVVNTGKNVGKEIAKYGAAGVGYSKAYDYAKSDTPKVKAAGEGLDWAFVKDSFGSSGTAEDNKLLNQAWDAGWRPGQVVPQKFQLKKYQEYYAEDDANMKQLQQLVASVK